MNTNKSGKSAPVTGGPNLYCNLCANTSNLYIWKMNGIGYQGNNRLIYPLPAIIKQSRKGNLWKEAPTNMEITTVDPF